ncbi:MAG: acetyl-CoA carboxylase carboxyltransferase subunit alpha [Chloroflexota bacterium]
MTNLLDFESGIRSLEQDLETARRRGNHHNGSAGTEASIRAAIDERLSELYQHLTPWQKVQVARHRERPYTLDYLQWAFADWVELRGDRRFGDDRALIGGPALINGRSVMVIGMQKGRDTRENVERNFGMPHPEGYRKAERLMQQAERLTMPVVTLIDVPGANAGLMDEERGQAEAIASCIGSMVGLRVPTVSLVIGEGGSGGALAIAVADRILMLEHAIFTVASPEAAAAILWRDAANAPEAAQNMKITAQDLCGLGLVDEVVPEPLGGAHRDHPAAAKTVAEAITRTLQGLEVVPIDELLEQRYHKYRDIGYYLE